MKKSFFLLVIFLIIVKTNAQEQSLYTLTTSTATYTDLENAISINNGQIWGNNDFNPIQVPFSFKIAEETISTFAFEQDNFTFSSEQSDNKYDLEVSGIVALDKNFAVGGLSHSPVSYKVEGTEGSRILKIEVKNAGSEDEFTENGTNNLFINFQIWIYETSNIIEYRYGNTNITAQDLALFQEDDGILIAIIDKNDDYACYLHGNPLTPDFIQLFDGAGTESEIDSYVMSSFPANGTVYRFTPSTTAGTEQFNKTQFSIYPNPVTSMLNISLEKMDVTDYIITDMTGKTIQKGTFKTLENTIEVGDLSSGMYGIKIGNTTQKFLKK